MIVERNRKFCETNSGKKNRRFRQMVTEKNNEIQSVMMMTHEHRQ